MPFGRKHCRYYQLTGRDPDCALQQRLCEAEEIANLGCWHLDLATGKLSISQGLKRLSGWPEAEESPNLEWVLEHIPGEEREAVLAGLDQARDGQSLEMEYGFLVGDELRRRLLRARPTVDEQGAISGVTGIVLDITDRAQAERALLTSEHRYHALMENASDAIVVVGPEGLFIDANRQAEILLGYSHEELLRLGPLDIHPPAEREKLAAAFAEMQSTGRSLYEHLVIRKDGSTQPVEVAGTRIDEGDRSLFLGTFRDIAARKHAEVELRRSYQELQAAHEQLKRINTQLVQSEKMASIGQLAAGVAHEINNPVGFINGNIGTLKRYLQELFELLAVYEEMERSLPEGHPLHIQLAAVKERIEYEFMRKDVVDLLEETREGLRRVKGIVQDLKDFSRAGRDTWEWSSLHAGLDSTLNIVWHELKYKAKVVKEYGALPDIECIPSQINQVFLNLLVNAADAIKEKGTVTIRTGVEGDEVFVSITDTGEGINPENLKVIFEPFFTTKPMGKGTGLGLSLAINIVQKHDGRIDVESVQGVGTNFTVRLPVQRRGERRQDGSADIGEQPPPLLRRES